MLHIIPIELSIRAQWRQREYWQALGHGAFELEVALLFESRGWKTEHCGGSGDGGIDVVVKKDSTTGYVQCKHYSFPVGVAAVREICGVARTDSTKPILVALSGFTTEATEWGQRAGVWLLCLDDLLEWARDMDPVWQAEIEHGVEGTVQSEAGYDPELAARVAEEVRFRDETLAREKQEKDTEFERGKQEWFSKHGYDTSRRRPTTANQLRDGDKIRLEYVGVVEIESVTRTKPNYSIEGRIVVRWSTGETALYESGLIDCLEWTNSV